jgi:hypothetical protein
MKKLAYTLAIIGILLMSKNSFSQEQVLPPTTNEGRCCQMIYISCDHPIGLKFADSIWVSSNSCPTMPFPIY